MYVPVYTSIGYALILTFCCWNVKTLIKTAPGFFVLLVIAYIIKLLFIVLFLLYLVVYLKRGKSDEQFLDSTFLEWAANL